MNSVQPRLGRCGDDGVGRQPGVGVLLRQGLVTPELVQAGHGHRGPIAATDEERLLARFALGVHGRGTDLPLVPTVRRNQASTDGGSAGEEGLPTSDSLRAVVIRRTPLT